MSAIINLPWYPRKIVHFSLVLSPSRTPISMSYKPRYYFYNMWLNNVCQFGDGVGIMLKNPKLRGIFNAFRGLMK
jgi:hypothetical protein